MNKNIDCQNCKHRLKCVIDDYKYCKKKLLTAFKHLESDKNITYEKIKRILKWKPKDEK